MGIPPRQANPPAHRQLVQDNNGHHAHGNDQGPGIYISYQVQYQLPRPNNEADQTLNRPLPVPPYPGFPGPGGAWQPWPTNDVTPTMHTPAPSVVPPGQTFAHPETTDHISQLSSGSISSVSTNASSSSENSEETEWPREAAAKAALNRLGIKSMEKTIKEKTPPASTSSSAPAQTTQMGENRKIPQLIPLFDFPSHGHTPRIVPQTRNSDLNPLQPYGSRLDNRSPFPSGMQMSTDMPTFLPQNQRLSSGILPGRLPTTLTDEQLETLDRVTRESIDERLRILENVSASVYRSIDDLMRLRSALPLVDMPSTQPDPAATRSFSTSSSNAESSQRFSERGKEKMREPLVDESIEIDLNDEQEDTISVE